MCHWNNELATCLGVIAIVRAFLFRPRICHWVRCPCVYLHRILIYKTQIRFRRLESCQVCIFIMSLLCLTLHVLHRVRISRAPVRPGDKPVCRAPSICGSAVWYQLHMTPFGAQNFEVSARFFEKCFTNAVCDLCPPRLHFCMFLYSLYYKWLVLAISDNAQNCVDIIAYDLQLTMHPN